MQQREAPGRREPVAASWHASSSAGECGAKDQVSRSGSHVGEGCQAGCRRPEEPDEGCLTPRLPGEERPRHVAIVGPTASGKTALALRLARSLGGFELVSVDAMAVYRELDIGTAKPTREERVGVTWHLTDLVEPFEEFSVACYQAAFREARSGIEARGNRALLVGGTGLYHRAVVDDLELPGRYPLIAAELAERAAEPDGAAKLYRSLVTLDPLAATRILPSNARRVLRALEVTLGSGRAFSSFGPGLESYRPATVLQVGIAMSRSELDERIESRLDTQLASGFLEEVRGLLEAGTDLSRTAAQALGYRELASHLRGERSLEEARSEILRRTRALARRQVAWFRRDPRVCFVEGTDDERYAAARALVMGG